MELNWLINRMSLCDNNECIIHNNSIYTYKDIIDKINYWREFITCNINKGAVVGVASDFSPNACALILALAENDNIIVPFSDIYHDYFSQMIDIANIEKLVTFCGDEYQIKSFNRKNSHPLISDLKYKGKPGLILFTSGSTGKPKGVVHDFESLIKKHMDINHSKVYRTLTFLLFDHIGGINTFLHTITNCGVIITTHDRRVESICRLIEKYDIELLPVSPSFLNLLLVTDMYKNYDLSSLKLISYGTEVMSSEMLKKLNNIFPNVSFKQTYGLSELGILHSKSLSNDSLWMKISSANCKIKVVNNILYIKNDTAMIGYLNDENPFEDGWFNTKDIVEVKDDYIHILGRQSDIINVGGNKVFPAEVENVILSVDNIKDVVVKGSPYPIVGNIVTAQVNTIHDEDPITTKNRIISYCKNHLDEYKIPMKIEITSDQLFSNRYKHIRK